MHLSTILDALIFAPVHFLQKVITSQFLPRKHLSITRWKSTLTADLVKMRILHFYRWYEEGQIANWGHCFFPPPSMSWGGMEQKEVVYGWGSEGWGALGCSGSHGEWWSHQQSYIDLCTQQYQMILWAGWCRTFGKVSSLARKCLYMFHPYSKGYSSW